MAMQRQLIPDEDHVVRYVPISRQARNPDGNLIGNGLVWSALQQRKDEKTVSVNWLEYHKGSRSNRLKLIKDELAKSFPPKSLSKALLAIGNVGVIKQACAEADNPVRVAHEPSNNSPSHAGIRRLPTDHDDLLDALAAEVFVDTLLMTNI